MAEVKRTGQGVCGVCVCVCVCVWISFKFNNIVSEENFLVGGLSE